MSFDYRVGSGFDAHKFASGRKLILGGVDIPFEKGLEGHSDADVLCHAIGDALLGAAGVGDLGDHFPPGDPEWKDADSLKLLSRIEHLVWKQDYKIVNIDATVILERPRISRYKEQMRNNIAEALKVDPLKISIKATTTEGMGFTGSGEGAAALATVLVGR